MIFEIVKFHSKIVLYLVASGFWNLEIKVCRCCTVFTCFFWELLLFFDILSECFLHLTQYACLDFNVSCRVLNDVILFNIFLCYLNIKAGSVLCGALCFILEVFGFFSDLCIIVAVFSLFAIRSGHSVWQFYKPVFDFFLFLYNVDDDLSLYYFDLKCCWLRWRENDFSTLFLFWFDSVDSLLSYTLDHLVARQLFYSFWRKFLVKRCVVGRRFGPSIIHRDNVYRLFGFFDGGFVNIILFSF